MLGFGQLEDASSAGRIRIDMGGGRRLSIQERFRNAGYYNTYRN